MGNYIDKTDLEERMSQVVLNNLCAKYPKDQVDDYINSVINRAESKINGYCYYYYEVPLVVSSGVQEWTFTICEYELYKNGQGNDIPTKYKTSFDITMKELELTSKGLFTPENAVKKARGSSIAVYSEAPLFTGKQMGDYDPISPSDYSW